MLVPPVGPGLRHVAFLGLGVLMCKRGPRCPGSEPLSLVAGGVEQPSGHIRNKKQVPSPSGLGVEASPLGSLGCPGRERRSLHSGSSWPSCRRTTPNRQTVPGLSLSAPRARGHVPSLNFTFPTAAFGEALKVRLFLQVDGWPPVACRLSVGQFIRRTGDKPGHPRARAPLGGNRDQSS